MSFPLKWPELAPEVELGQAFLNNEDLKPAKSVPPMRLQTGRRTNKDMDELLRAMQELQLIKALKRGRDPSGRASSEFESWLKQMGSSGEQFSWPQLETLVFGVVIGNPVLLVLDDSTSMDIKFTLGDGTLARREFCHSQLETVLKGLSNGTYFNVIRYSSSAQKIFQNPVLTSEASIDAAMQAVTGTWRGTYTPGDHPADFLRNVQVFALQLEHQLIRSTRRSSMEALQLAYATAYLPSQQIGKRRHALHDHGSVSMTKDLPQIYFLTSGQPDGGARQILDNISELDKGRDIPVNSIAFLSPGDLVANQFVKDLANKTGGFFRLIEHASP